MDKQNFYVEKAKSEHEFYCYECDQLIKEGRIMLIVEDRGSLVCYHPWCFEVPSKFRMAPIDFLFYVVQDNDGDILPGELSTLDEMMSSKPVRFRKEGSTMAKIRKEYEGRFLNDEQPISRAAQLLGIYQSKTKDELAQILHYNRQIKMGEREDLMMRILDGAEHGILGKCPQCGSRLGLSHISSSNDDDNEDSFIVVCKGDFFVPKCDYTASTLEAPRVPLWFTEQPTKEQENELHRLLGYDRRYSSI